MVLSVLLLLSALSAFSVDSLAFIFKSKTQDSSETIRKYIDHVHFIGVSSDGVIKLENGLVITFLKPLPSSKVYKEKNDAFYYVPHGGDSYRYLTIEGVRVKLENTGKNILIIRWWESVFGVGDYRGAPLPDNVNYEYANSRKIPDTPIAPGQVPIYRDIYLSRMEWRNARRIVDSYYNGWETVYVYENYKEYSIIGQPVPRASDLRLAVELKVYDQKGNGKYYQIPCPPVGVRIRENE